MARNLNLSSSLRPLLLFFRCIGIHFPDEEKDPSLKLSKLSKLKSVHAGICFVLNLSSQVATLFFIFNKIFLFETTGQESVDTITSATLLAIDYTNYASFYCINYRAAKMDCHNKIIFPFGKPARSTILR